MWSPCGVGGFAPAGDPTHGAALIGHGHGLAGQVMVPPWCQGGFIVAVPVEPAVDCQPSQGWIAPAPEAPLPLGAPPPAETSSGRLPCPPCFGERHQAQSELQPACLGERHQRCATPQQGWQPQQQQEFSDPAALHAGPLARSGDGRMRPQSRGHLPPLSADGPRADAPGGARRQCWADAAEDAGLLPPSSSLATARPPDRRAAAAAEGGGADAPGGERRQCWADAAEDAGLLPPASPRACGRRQCWADAAEDAGLLPPSSPPAFARRQCWADAAEDAGLLPPSSPPACARPARDGGEVCSGTALGLAQDAPRGAKIFVHGSNGTLQHVRQTPPARPRGGPLAAADAPADTPPPVARRWAPGAPRTAQLLGRRKGVSPPTHCEGPPPADEQPPALPATPPPARPARPPRRAEPGVVDAEAAPRPSEGEAAPLAPAAAEPARGQGAGGDAAGAVQSGPAQGAGAGESRRLPSHGRCLPAPPRSLPPPPPCSSPRGAPAPGARRAGHRLPTPPRSPAPEAPAAPPGAHEAGSSTAAAAPAKLRHTGQADTLPRSASEATTCASPAPSEQQQSSPESDGDSPALQGGAAALQPAERQGPRRSRQKHRQATQPAPAAPRVTAPAPSAAKKKVMPRRGARAADKDDDLDWLVPARPATPTWMWALLLCAGIAAGLGLGRLGGGSRAPGGGGGGLPREALDMDVVYVHVVDMEGGAPAEGPWAELLAPRAAGRGARPPGRR